MNIVVLFPLGLASLATRDTEHFNCCFTVGHVTSRMKGGQHPGNSFNSAYLLTRALLVCDPFQTQTL